jgi:hypothetical protein
MKKDLLQIAFVLVLFSTTLFSQIPNAGFENWTNSDPVGWITLDIFGDAVSQSSDSHSGSSAAKMQIIGFSGTTFPPILFSGYFVLSEKPGSLTGYYKFVPTDANEVFSVFITLYQGLGFAGSGYWETSQTISSYTQFTVPIEYFPPEVIPDSAYIEFLLTDTTSEGTGGIGSYALIDDLGLGGFVGIKEIANNKVPTSYELMQNYPNPFNPSTKIEYSIPEESFVELKVYNLIGQEVATLVYQHQKAGTYRADFNAEGMQSGIYIAKLTTNGFTRVVKMTLLK